MRRSEAPSMARTLLRCRQGEIAYYLLETDSSAGSGRGTKRRYLLCRTSDHGKRKDGRITLKTTAAVQLLSTSEHELFNACDHTFRAQRAVGYHRPEIIRGRAGRWEGEAFADRRSSYGTLSHG